MMGVWNRLQQVVDDRQLQSDSNKLENHLIALYLASLTYERVWIDHLGGWGGGGGGVRAWGGWEWKSLVYTFRKTAICPTFFMFVRHRVLPEIILLASIANFALFFFLFPVWSSLVFSFRKHFVELYLKLPDESRTGHETVVVSK